MATLWTLHGDGKTIRPDTVVAPDERLSWPPAIGDYGMNWWRYCFAPVLGLTLVHGVVFALLMFDAARP